MSLQRISPSILMVRNITRIGQKIKNQNYNSAQYQKPIINISQQSIQTNSSNMASAVQNNTSSNNVASVDNIPTNNNENNWKNKFNIWCSKYDWSEHKEFLLKYGRKGLAAHKSIDFAFFGLIYFGVHKINFLKNQRTPLRIFGNLVITGVIYKLAWPVRIATIHQTVPYIFGKFNIKASEEERKTFEERFKAFQNGTYGYDPFKFGGCRLREEKRKNQMLLADAGISKDNINIENTIKK